MLNLDPAKCSGCRRCEVHCSFFHSGRVGRSASRIKVVKIEDQGLDYPVVCQGCLERYCTECPVEAIRIGSAGEIQIDPELCTGCGTCESLCPVGAIELREESPLVCDLCSGDPRCVRACTMGALTFEPGAKDVVSLRAFHEGSEGLSPEEKRIRFAQASFKNLRKRWVSARRG
jgi:anaerobic carbon-monoxide dehydrogenase iron sulfur subunit